MVYLYRAWNIRTSPSYLYTAPAGALLPPAAHLPPKFSPPQIAFCAQTARRTQIARNTERPKKSAAAALLAAPHPPPIVRAPWRPARPSGARAPPLALGPLGLTLSRPYPTFALWQSKVRSDGMTWCTCRVVGHDTGCGYCARVSHSMCGYYAALPRQIYNRLCCM